MNKKALELMYGNLSLQQLQAQYKKAMESQDFAAMKELSPFIKKRQDELNNSPF